MKKLHEIRDAVQHKHPLIHCITNPISINQCANAILAVGARPIMAEHPLEVREITKTADALLCNLGNITDARMESMKIALITAKEKEIPTVIDAVGIACSALRRNFLGELLKTGTPTVIKGNYSEIAALYFENYRSSGVDADASLDQNAVSRMAAELAQSYGTVILASGKTDIITDGKRLICGNNGTPRLASVTGTGCMLGALCAAYLSVSRDMDAAVCACSVLGICGQLAQTAPGSGSFMVHLMDGLSTLSAVEFETDISLEEFDLETI